MNSFDTLQVRKVYAFADPSKKKILIIHIDLFYAYYRYPINYLILIIFFCNLERVSSLVERSR